MVSCIVHVYIAHKALQSTKYIQFTFFGINQHFMQLLYIVFYIVRTCVLQMCAQSSVWFSVMHEAESYRSRLKQLEAVAILFGGRGSLSVL
jgi:hypothetical protein